MSKRRHGLLGPLRQAPGLSAGLACGVALIAVSACSSGRSGLFDGTPYAGDIEPTIGRPQVAEPPPPVEPTPAPEPSVEAAELPTADDAAPVVEAPTPQAPVTSEALDDAVPEQAPAPTIATAPPTVSTPPVTASPPPPTEAPAPAPPVTAPSAPAVEDPVPEAPQAQVATAPPQLILAPPAIAPSPRPTTVAEAPAPAEEQVQGQLDRSAEIVAAQRDRVPPAPALPATPAPQIATPPVAAAETPATETPAAPPAGTPAIDRLPRPPTREGFPSLSDVPDLPDDVPTQAELAEMQAQLERDRAALQAGEVPQRLTPRIPDQPASGFSGLGDAPAGPPAPMREGAPTLGVPSSPADAGGPQSAVPVAPSGQPQAAALPSPPVPAIQAASLPPLALQIPPPPQRVRVATAPAPVRQPDPPTPAAPASPEVAAVAPPSPPATPSMAPAGPQALPQPLNEDGQPPVIPGPVETQPLADFRVDEPDAIPDTQLPADPTERAFLLAFAQSGRAILPDGQISGTARLPALAVLPDAARPQTPPGQATPTVQPLAPAQQLPVTALPPPVQPLLVQPAVVQAPVTGQPIAFPTTPLQQGALAATIFFAEGSARLSNRDREVIAAIVEEHRRTGARIRVLGHASRSGAIADPILRGVTNYGESLNRARAVGEYLSQLGVPATMVSVDAAGEQLAGSDEIRNRRAEIYLDYAIGQG